MKKKMKYTDEKMGEIKIIKDFLPKPEELILKGKNVKVTLNLSKSSVDYFKKVAFKHGSQYQKVIRNLLDKYTAHFSE